VHFSKKLTSIESSQLSEDDPIRLSQETGFPATAGELLVRHVKWMRRIIAKEARRVGLAWGDTEDAQQEGMFAFWHAVAKFDTRGHPGCSSFRTFLWVVVMARFRNYVRRLRRWEDRYDRSIRPEDLERVNMNEPVWADERENPVAQLTGQEFQGLHFARPPVERNGKHLGRVAIVFAAAACLGSDAPKHPGVQGSGRARARRLATVPSFQPSCLAASALVRPSRQHRRRGVRNRCGK
jgi:RNA polymerase sigma factor (sigma-70 family)